MKTQIIRLESHDDVVSIRDKISWSKAARILLAFPRRRPPDLRRLDLVLLQRSANQMGGQLALVTLEKDILEQAEQLGIPVFASIPAAQRGSWRVPLRKRRRFKRAGSRYNELVEKRAGLERNQKPLESSWGRLLAFSMGVAGVLALTFFFFPAATITVRPVQSEQRLELGVWASPDVPSVLLSGAIPAEIHTVIVGGQVEGEPGSSVNIATGTASGDVILTNLTEQPIDVPAGTVFRTTGSQAAQFESLRAVMIPAGVDQTVQVAIRARNPGTIGNVAAGLIRAIEGPVGLSATVTNPQSTRGGSDRRGRVASQADYDRLNQTLLTNLAQAAERELMNQLPVGHILLVETISPNQVVEEIRNPSVGVPADQLFLDLQVEFQAWSVREADLSAIAQAALDANLPADLIPVKESLRVRAVSEPMLENDGPARWEIETTRFLKTRWDRDSISTLVRGQNVQEALVIISSQMNLVSPPEIQVRPSWWNRLPFLPFRIEVIEA